MLSTTRLTLRPWDADDWRLLVPLVTDPEVMRHITGGEPWDEARMQAFVARQRACFAERAHGFWKLHEREAERFVGFCGLQPLRGHEAIEAGWWLARDAWGRGLATEAARAAIADGFERLGLTRIVAIARPDNVRSQAVMTRAGMTYERTLTYEGLVVVRYAIEVDGPRAGSEAG